MGTATLLKTGSRRLRRALGLPVRDGLTGLVDLASFHLRLHREAQLAHAGSAPLALVCLNLDRMKDFNQAHGYAVGDRVLSMLALRLQTMTRSGDLLARTGGKEFALLMPETGVGPASRQAQWLRDGIARLDFSAYAAMAVEHHRAMATAGDTMTPPRMALRASLGVACLSGDDGAALLAAARNAVERAKRAGGDRIVVER